MAAAPTTDVVKSVRALLMGKHSVFPIKPFLHNVTQAEQVCMCNQKLENTTVMCPRHRVLQQKE